MLFEKILGSVKNQTMFNQNIAMLKDWIYEIKPFKNDRTILQNRYLRGWVYGTIAEYMWEDTDYVHWVMGMKFLLDKTKKAPYVRSTASLTTQEFSEYVEKIRDFVAQWVYVPTPEEWKRANWLMN